MEKPSKITRHPFFFLATVALLFGILLYAHRFLIPLALAILFSFLLKPAVRALEKRGLPRVPSVLVVAAVAFVVFAGTGAAITSQVALLTAEKLQDYRENLKQKMALIRGDGDDSTVNRTAKALDDFARVLVGDRSDDKKTSDRQASVAVAADPWSILTHLFNTLWEMIRTLAMIGLIFIMVVLMLIFHEDLRDRLIRLSGYGRLTVTTKALDEAGTRISDYMFRKTLINGVFGLIVTIVLFPFFEIAVLWGFLLAVLRFIPNLGTWLAPLPPLVISLVAFESWWPFLLVLAVYIGGELVCTNFVEPTLIGRHIGVSPLGAIVSLTIWTWVWGPVGLLLAIPLTVCLVVLGKYVPQLSFLNVLLSNQPAMETNVRYYQRLLAMDHDEATVIVEKFLQSYPKETVYDELILSALSFAKRDYIGKELNDEDKKFIVESTRQILEDMWHEDPEERLTGPEETSVPRRGTPVLGYAVRDEADELGLLMLQQLLKDGGCELEAAASDLLSSEVVEWVQKKKPALICLVSLAPGDWARCRFLCKRLSRTYPGLKIVVARLGLVEEEENHRELLRSAGAYSICTTLLDARTQILQLVHLLVNPVAEVETEEAVEDAEQPTVA